ncbi:MAG: uroporphyrinogen decarboxylase family protein [Phycisphaerae bacterium]
MTPKERVRTAFGRGRPDRLPASVIFNSETEGGLFRIGAISAEEKIKRYFRTDDYEVVLKRLGIDARWLRSRTPQKDPDRETRWHGFVRGLKAAQTVEDLKRLETPDWRNYWDCSHLKEDLQKILDLDQSYAVFIEGPSIWEMVRCWRPMDVFMVEWLTDPEFAVTLFEMVYNFYMACYEAYVEELGDLVHEIDHIHGGSDFGMQDRPIVDPKLFERDYEPFLRREIAFFKRYFPEAVFEFHCCGSAVDFIPYLVRSGVDVLHPVQPGCAGMDFDQLKAAWGEKLAFRGGIDAQGVLARGTETEVREWVRYAFQTLGRNGGYMLDAHGIMPEVPVKNVLAVYDTVQNECWY